MPGRPKGSKNIRTLTDKMTLSQICKNYSRRAVDVLVEIMDNPESKDSDRITASIAILDRAYGKPISSVEMVDDEGNALQPQINFYIPDNGRKLDAN